MKGVWSLVLGLVMLAAPVAAQTAPTFLLTDTSGRFTLTANPEHNQMFGTPPIPVLSSYVFDFFLKASVTNVQTCATTPAAPVFTADGGKPTPDASNTLTFGTIKSLFPGMTANTEYFACARALGSPNTLSSPRSAVAADAAGLPIPFGFPAAPGRPAVAPSITP